jgi:transglutaminase-like putative cysteine protease
MKSPDNQQQLLTNVDEFLRSKFVYSDEKIETLQYPDYMLSGLEMSGRLVGDCDDISTLHAALLAALGFQVRFVAIRSLREDVNFDHVYLEVKLNDEWIMYDITLPLGTKIEYFGRIAIQV